MIVTGIPETGKQYLRRIMGDASFSSLRFRETMANGSGAGAVAASAIRHARLPFVRLLGQWRIIRGTVTAFAKLFCARFPGRRANHVCGERNRFAVIQRKRRDTYLPPANAIRFLPDPMAKDKENPRQNRFLPERGCR
ncbi:MAG: hypothetical protein CW346_01980 [Bacillaceae bacterium]|nr:hypothetical protein [Bacillaceae bacterium]